MSKRTAQFVSTTVATILAGVHLTTVSDSASSAPDNCLVAPNRELADGGHWNYRIEHGTKRHCWYVKGSKEKPAETTDTSSSDAAAPPPKPSNPSIADAHAELPLPQTPLGETAAPQNQQSNVILSNSTIASRWPAPSGVASTTSPAPVVNDRLAEAQPTTNAVPPPPSAAASAVTDASPAKQSSPLPKLLVVMFGALSVGGIVASAFLRSRRKPTKRRNLADEPYPLWEPAPSSHRNRPVPRQNVRTRPADDPSRRIEEMLAELSRTRPR